MLQRMQYALPTRRAPNRLTGRVKNDFRRLEHPVASSGGSLFKPAPQRAKLDRGPPPKNAARRKSALGAFSPQAAQAGHPFRFPNMRSMKSRVRQDRTLLRHLCVHGEAEGGGGKINRKTKK